MTKNSAENSWQIIRRILLGDKKPSTVGGMIALQQAAQVFAQLADAGLLRDAKTAGTVFQGDREVTVALLNQNIVASLKKAGLP